MKTKTKIIVRGAVGVATAGIVTTGVLMASNLANSRKASDHDTYSSYAYLVNGETVENFDAFVAAMEEQNLASEVTTADALSMKGHSEEAKEQKEKTETSKAVAVSIKTDTEKQAVSSTADTLPVKAEEATDSKTSAGSSSNLALELYFTDKAIVDPGKVETSLNVRSAIAAEGSDSIVDTIAPEEMVQVLSVSDGWTQIASGEISGWVKSEFLLTGKDAAQYVAEHADCYAEVKAASLNIRQAADASAESLGEAKEGEAYPVLNTENGWVKVEVKQTVGYLSASYVTFNYDYKGTILATGDVSDTTALASNTGAETTGSNAVSESPASSSASASLNKEHSEANTQINTESSKQPKSEENSSTVTTAPAAETEMSAEETAVLAEIPEETLGSVEFVAAADPSKVQAESIYQSSIAEENYIQSSKQAAHESSVAESSWAAAYQSSIAEENYIQSSKQAAYESSVAESSWAAAYQSSIAEENYIQASKQAAYESSVAESSLAAAYQSSIAEENYIQSSVAAAYESSVAESLWQAAYESSVAESSWAAYEASVAESSKQQAEYEASVAESSRQQAEYESNVEASKQQAAYESSVAESIWQQNQTTTAATLAPTQPETQPVASVGSSVTNCPLSADVVSYALSLCRQYGVDYQVIFSVMYQESHFFPNLVSSSGSGATGLMQIIQRYSQDRMNRLGVTDLMDPCQNILVGVDLLAEYYNTYGNWTSALTCYRWGTPSGSQDYANLIMSRTYMFVAQ